MKRLKQIVGNWGIVKLIRLFVDYNKHINSSHFISVEKMSFLEKEKSPKRTDVINFLLSLSKEETFYLEIGVRNPKANFAHIKAKNKYGVDPGVEFIENPVDFKMTSDQFFDKLSANEILSDKIKFDIIFIDGLHLANQVDRDITNALNYIKDDGFVVLHDCNPPSEWHSRENFNYKQTPAGVHWNGTTWKAFLKWRFNPEINSCCIDSDWGVGIISKTHQIGKSICCANAFFEFNDFDKNRKHYLNLIDFSDFKKIF